MTAEAKIRRAKAARASDARKGRRTIRINADAETAAAFLEAAEKYASKAGALRAVMQIYRNPS